jgi:DNA-binding IclR family transcriptional regulator
MKPEGAEAGVKSALRVFDILELFNARRAPLRLKEIADALALPASSASGLLRTMAARGYLAFDPASHTYFPAERLAHLAGWVRGARFESGPVAQAMRTLREQTGELIVLAADEDLQVDYIAALRSSHGIQLWTPPGTRLPAVNLGLGWLFLAKRGADAAETLARSLAAGLVAAGALDPVAIAARIAACRDQRILATDARDYPAAMHPGHPGGGMIWGLIEGPPGHRTIGLGIGGPAERLAANRARYIAALTDALDSIAAAAVAR